MRRLNDSELTNINGGSITGTLLSSIIRGVGVVVEIGRAFGTALRRIVEKKLCSI